MSFYNMFHGANPAVFFVAPMITDGEHPQTYFPRFRDCFTAFEEMPEMDGNIGIFTRAGGGNREMYEEQIDILRDNPNYISDADYSFDSTYAMFFFKVPEQWKKDFKIYNEQGITPDSVKLLSEEYKKLIIKTYPKIEDKLTYILKHGKAPPTEENNETDNNG